MSGIGYGSVLDTVGNTPLVRIPWRGLERVELYGKLEAQNPTGSVKDRAAAYALERLLADGTLRPGSRVVESSSGNFGVSLAAYCMHLGLEFHCVVDPRINPINETLIRAMGATVTKVTELDKSGGYLLTRLRVVREILEREPGTYWMNQYANPLIAEAYYETLGVELAEAFPRLDYLFVAVSSGGTIAGVSRRIKERFPACTIVAVDARGSAVFGGPTRSRYIPGIGSSMVPKILETASIDRVVIIDEVPAVRACHRLLAEHAVFAGGSSGFVLAAAEDVLAASPDVVACAVLPDRGDRYASNVYDDEWCRRLTAGKMSDLPPKPGP